MLPLRRILLRGLLGLLLVAGFAEARRAVNSCPTIQANSSNLLVQSPVLQYTVTTFDPGWFSTGQSTTSPTLFLLQISPSLLPYADSLRLRVYIEADTTLGRNPSAPRVVAFDRITDPLPASDFGVFLTSAQVFDLPYQAGGVKFDQSELYQIIATNRQTPEMNLQFKFALTCEDGGLVGQNLTTITLVDFPSGQAPGKLRFVHTVQALSPGTDIANAQPVPIYTLNPTFQLVSELFNNQEFVYPPNEPKIEVFLYELQPGQNPADAMQGMEFAKFPVTDQFPIVYPAGLPRLNPGMEYVWRARALLRGPAQEYRFSNALYFQVDSRLDGGSSPTADPGALSDLKSFEDQVKYGDDYVKRVMAALKIILGENYDVFDLSRADKIPAKGQIRLNGRPYTLEELERLAREFHQSRHSLTRLRFQ